MENYIIDFTIHNSSHFQHPFLMIVQQGCFCQGTRSMPSVNVSCGAINSVFLRHITFTTPHFTPMRRIAFFISFRKRNVHWDAFCVWFLSVCSPITILEDYFSISYLSIFMKAIATHCTALPLYCLFDILPGKPPNEQSKRDTLLWESFSYCSYRKTPKLDVLYCSRDLSTQVNPISVFVSINNLLTHLFLEMFWEWVGKKPQTNCN